MAPPPYRRHVTMNARGQRALLALVVVALVAFFVGVANGAGGSESGGKVGFIKPIGPIEPSQFQLLEKARKEVLTYTDYVAKGTDKNKEVALTFDDGPGEFTPQILKILNETKTPATFFQLGVNVGEYPLIAQAVAVGGYPIANHTWDHKDLKTLAPADQAAELDNMNAAVQKIGIPTPTLFRPPYGSYNQSTLDIINQKKMLMVLWSVDSLDWQQPGADAIVQNVLGNLSAGDIVLMHDAGGPREQTVAALPRIIKGIKQKGLKPVTVAQLLADDPPPRDQEPPPLAAAG